jgi:hypothetical protein
MILCRNVRLLRARGASGLFVAAAVCILTACSGSVAPSPSPGAAQDVTLETACSDYAKIFRMREVSCYHVAPESNESTLIARQVQSCVLLSAAPGSTVAASYWESCAANANNDCGAYQCGTYPAGAGQLGDPCLDSTQCADLWCRGTQVVDASGAVSRTAVQCGACANRLSAGAPCNVATDDCAVGLSCFDGSCRATGQRGAACASASDCAPPLTCKSLGSCDDVAFTGQSCFVDSDCTTDQACDTSSYICTPFQFGQAGAACDGHVRRCEAGGCNIAASASTGTCPTVLGDASPCDPGDRSTVCDNYASCFDGTCQIVDPSSCK